MPAATLPIASAILPTLRLRPVLRAAAFLLVGLLAVPAVGLASASGPASWHAAPGHAASLLPMANDNGEIPPRGRHADAVAKSRRGTMASLAKQRASGGTAPRLPTAGMADVASPASALTRAPPRQRVDAAIADDPSLELHPGQAPPNG